MRRFLVGAFMVGIPLLAAPGIVSAASIVTIGTAPILHPTGGRDASLLSLEFPTGWWEERHTGTMQGSGFVWTYDPSAFGEGLAKTFEVENIFRPDMTKVMTLTLAVRDPFMASPLTEYCSQQICSNSRHWDFWPQAATLTGPPFILAGASNLGYDDEAGVWRGQFQFRVRPQPAAEYITFESSIFPATLEDIVTMKLEITCVPEPSTWAMMLVGFGAAGFAARRRRTLADVPHRIAYRT